MTDRELLELSAKAAGLEHEGFIAITDDSRGPGLALWSPRDGYSCWNPLEDDGDALRLAVSLHIDFKSWDYVVRVFAGDPESGKVLAAIECTTSQSLDINGATRRAIVRAAAEIGRNMP